jgi:hypothetical protein
MTRPRASNEPDPDHTRQRPVLFGFAICALTGALSGFVCGLSTGFALWHRRPPPPMVELHSERL